MCRLEIGYRPRIACLEATLGREPHPIPPLHLDGPALKLDRSTREPRIAGQSSSHSSESGHQRIDAGSHHDPVPVWASRNDQVSRRRQAERTEGRQRGQILSQGVRRDTGQAAQIVDGALESSQILMRKGNPQAQRHLVCTQEKLSRRRARVEAPRPGTWRIPVVPVTRQCQDHEDRAPYPDRQLDRPIQRFCLDKQPLRLM
jgi:hypothetical protein